MNTKNTTYIKRNKTTRRNEKLQKVWIEFGLGQVVCPFTCVFARLLEHFKIINDIGNFSGMANI